ncbi:MAG: hypothetical protein ACJ8BW_09745, partial [Ktedonobacteraceae bacterium]
MEWGPLRMSSPPETERPRPSRWKDDGRPQGMSSPRRPSPTLPITTPAPTGTRGLLPKNLYLKGPCTPLGRDQPGPDGSHLIAFFERYCCQGLLPFLAIPFDK